MVNDSLLSIKMLDRIEVDKILQNIYKFPLCIVSAALGYGKTTAVREFFEKKKEAKLFWYTLVENELDYIWLWKRVTMILNKKENEMFKSIKNLDFPETHEERKHIINILRKVVKEDVFLVIDNYHENKSKYLDELIKDIVYANVSNFHIVLIGRTYPNLSYEEMLLKDLCVLVEQSNLALNETEIEKIFYINGIYLSQEELKKIYEYTDGWISAVYLTLLDYLQNGKSDMGKVINLLKNTIFDKLSDKAQKLLAIMSPFDTFTVDQAIFISGIEDCKKILFNIIKSNTFVKYDVFTNTYCVHVLLKSVTRDEMVRFGYSEKQLTYKCGKWYESQKKYVYACKNYIYCNEIDSVFKVLQEQESIEIYKLAPITFINFYKKLPMEIKLKYIASYMVFIYTCAFFVNWGKGTKLFNNLIEYIEKNRNSKVIQEISSYYGDIKFLKSILSFNNLELMTREIEEASKLLDGQPSKVFNSSHLDIWTIITLSVAYYNKIGEFKNNIEFEKKYTKSYLSIINESDAGWNTFIEAEYEVSIGNFEKARELADQSIQKSIFKKNYNVLIGSSFVKMRCNIYLGNREELYLDLKKLQEIMKNIPRSTLTVSFEIVEGYIYSCLNKIENISEWLFNYDFEYFPSLQIFNKLKNGYILYGKILIHQKKYIELEALAEDMLARKTGNKYLLIIVYGEVYNAISSKYLYGIEIAANKLKRAFQIVKKDKILIPFIENSIELMDILMYMKNEDSFVEMLLPYCEEYIKGLKNFDEIDENKKKKSILSKREIEILKLVEQGYKNSEIADEIHIAKVTVEKTLSSVYKKLKVSNRVEAVKKLRNTL